MFLHGIIKEVAVDFAAIVIRGEKICSLSREYDWVTRRPN